MTENARKAYQAFAKYKLDVLYADEMSNKDIAETLIAIRNEIITEIDGWLLELTEEEKNGMC